MVPETVLFNDYEGTGTNGPFAYTFPILASSDLRVIKTSPEGVETILALGTHYTVTGARSLSGGSVTLTSVLTLGWSISIQRKVTLTQDVDIRNQGRYYPETLEDALDKIVMGIQQLDADVKALGLLPVIPPEEVIVSITPEYSSVLVDGTVVYTATVTGASNESVSWAVDGIWGGSSAVGALSVVGLTCTYTAPSTAGYHVVTATSVEDPTSIGSTTIYVNTVATVNINLSPNVPSSVQVLGTLALVATVTGNANTSVTWTVDGVSNGNASVGTITGSGNSVVYTAPATVGVHIVTATSVADGTKTASVTITLTAGSPISITLSPSTTQQLAIGSILPITVTIIGTTNTNTIWTVDDITNGNTAVGTITGTGLTRTYAAASSGGTHTLTVTSAADATKTASLTCVTIPNVTLSVWPLTASPVVSTSVQFTSSMTSGGMEMGTNTALVWYVDGIQNGNATVGIMTQATDNEMRTPIYAAPASAGLHTLVARSVSYPSLSVTIQVSVLASGTVQVSLSPSSQNVDVNSTFDLTSTVTGNADTSVVWTVDGITNGNSSVGTITGGTASYIRAAYGLRAYSLTGVYVNAGDLIIVPGATYSTLNTANITDNASGGSNVYNQCGAGKAYTDPGVEQHLCYGFAKATETLIIALNDSGSYPATMALVVSGASGSLATVLDGYTYDTEEGSAGTAHTSAAITTTNASDLVVVGWVQNIADSYLTENGTGFTKSEELVSSGFPSWSIFTKVVTSIGTYSDTVTSNTSVYAGNIIAAFKINAGTGSNTVTYTAPAAEGSHTIVATSVADGAKSASCAVTVNNPSAAYVGFGYATTGGVGYSDVHVTNLNDSGTGSFRAAMGSNRRIVFDVGGSITLNSIVTPSGIANLTIDGSTAPSPGITFLMYPIQFNNSHNIVITNFRHRAGDYGGGDETGDGGNIVFYNCYNLIVDHLSASGYTDESIDFFGGCHDFTIQNCIVGVASPGSTSLQYMVSDGSYNASCYHNLCYLGGYRSPAISWHTDGSIASGIVADVVNNVDWRYLSYGTTIYWGGKANIIGNYYYTTTHPGESGRAVNFESQGLGYSSGNYSKDGSGVAGNVGSAYTVPALAQITATTASIAAAYVVANAGCRIGGLDAVDSAIISEITNTGL